MKFRTLGRCGLKVSEMGFGGWGLGGEAYGPVDQATSEQTLREALDRGIRFFDTSNLYGAGRSEKLIGRVLAGSRSDVLIATKGGLDRTGPDQWPVNGRPERLREGLEGSLRRLKLDFIDLYQLHRIDPDVPEEDQFGFLQKAQEEGKGRWMRPTC